MSPPEQHDRAVTPVVANILIVAIVVILAAVVSVHFLGFTSDIAGPTAEATFEYDESAVGIEMTAEQIAEDVAVEINGQQVATFDSSDAGQSRLIPTSPGDRLTVVSADGSRTVLVSRTVDDRDEIGDFIAHYTFEEGSGTTLFDRSGNDNDGSFNGDPDWIDGTDPGLDFDGSDDYIKIDDLSAGVDVEEFTVAVAYKQDPGANRVHQLVEHEYSATGDEWFLETHLQADNDYQIEYAVNFPAQLESGYSYSAGDRRVAVGTYDGSDYELFVDGTSAGSKSASVPVGMDEMTIAKDFESDIQYFDGEIYEIRLYYAAFDDDSVESITKAMQ